jgi:hypothetical protein
MRRTILGLAAASVLLAVSVGAGSALAGEQDAIDGCIDQLRKVGGPDARGGGTVLSSEYSEAGTLVMLRDAGGTVWRCLGANDGTVGELRVAQGADDGGGAMAGASQGGGAEGTTTTERVRFHGGSTGAELTGRLTPGSSKRYLLGAKKGQDLYVRVAPKGGALDYQIFNPDGSFLLDQISWSKEYRGQLWQAGDHVVEVINRGNHTISYNVIFGID